MILRTDSVVCFLTKTVRTPIFKGVVEITGAFHMRLLNFSNSMKFSKTDYGV